MNEAGAVGDQKRNFFFLPKAERETFKKVHFCRNTERTERESFCRKRPFLPKDGLSGRHLCLFRPEPRRIFLPKQDISAERRHFCRKKLFLQKHRKTKLKQKEFLPNFCRKATEMPFRSPTATTDPTPKIHKSERPPVPSLTEVDTK